MRVVTFESKRTKESHTAFVRALIKKTLIKPTATAIKLFKVRDKLPTICVFGHDDLKLITPIHEDYEEERLDCRCYTSDSCLEQVLIQDRPHVIITVGDRPSFPNLAKASFEVQQRWLHYDTLPDLTQLGVDAYGRYLTNVFNRKEVDENPLVTVFTPAYKTGEKIYRPFLSLKEQTYANWEWIIVDDSNDDGKTFKMLCSLTKRGHRYGKELGLQPRKGADTRGTRP
jgi:hypothetical protein